MRRFSEDIDLTVDVKGLSNSKAKKTLEIVSQKYTSLLRNKGDLMEENKKGSITAVCSYDSVYGIKEDALQRYGKVKVESTSFTISDPISDYEIMPLIYRVADEEIKKYLEQNECTPFHIKTISIERMFADKLLAAEFYLERNQLFDVAKHIYDINYLYTLPQIKQMLMSNDLIIHNLSYKRIEENKRIGSNLNIKPLNEFSIFDKINNSKLINEYNHMMEIYVFDEKYKYDYKDIIQTFQKLKNIFFSVSEQEQLFLKSNKYKQICEDYNIDIPNASINITNQDIDKNFDSESSQNNIKNNIDDEYEIE